MIICNIIAYFFALLALRIFGPASALPAITTITQTTIAVDPLHKYDIRLCNSTQRDALARAIDSALNGALSAWHDAASGNTTYKPFFKNRQYPVLDTLSKVASYEAAPARGNDIFWACIIPETFKRYFPRANSDVYKECESGVINGYIIVDSFILVCPQIFDAPPEPLPPQPDECPAVSGNSFSDDVALPIYRSDIVLESLVDYVLPTQVARTNVTTFDDVITANAYSSYLSPRNYQIYSISKSSMISHSPSHLFNSLN